MAALDDDSSPSFRGRSGTKLPTPSTENRPDVRTDHKKGIRLLFIYCLAAQVFSIYRAYEVYQTYDSWSSLTRKNKFFFAWGIATTIVMAIFTVAFAVQEYRWQHKARNAIK